MRFTRCAYRHTFAPTGSIVQLHRESLAPIPSFSCAKQLFDASKHTRGDSTKSQEREHVHSCAVWTTQVSSSAAKGSRCSSQSCVGFIECRFHGLDDAPILGKLQRIGHSPKTYLEPRDSFIRSNLFKLPIHLAALKKPRRGEFLRLARPWSARCDSQPAEFSPRNAAKVNARSSGRSMRESLPIQIRNMGKVWNV